MRVIIATLLVCVAAVGSRAQSDPIVAVTGGQIRGSSLGGGAVFRGIPFAAPPTGERRWREPAAVQPWSGVREATKFGAICPQQPSPIVGEAIKTASEDAHRIAETIRAAVEQPYLLGELPYHCTSSVGVDISHQGALDLREAMKRADAAMYKAKARGRNNICLTYAENECPVA